MRRPPVTAPDDAPLLEKFPHLEAEWKSGMGGDRSQLLQTYEHMRAYAGCKPIDWKKPEVAVKAERACSEMTGTLPLVQQLATMAHDYAVDAASGQPPNPHRQGFLVHFAAANTSLVNAQLALETLEGIAEYRWLQANVPGDFGSMPQEGRRRYTSSQALLSDHRLGKIKELVADPWALKNLAIKTTDAFDEFSHQLTILQNGMQRNGPLYGLHSREARMLAISDHNTCLRELIPHVQAQMEIVQAQIAGLGRHAALDLAIRRKGEDGEGVSTVRPLGVEFKPPASAGDLPANTIDMAARDEAIRAGTVTDLSSWRRGEGRNG